VIIRYNFESRHSLDNSVQIWLWSTLVSSCGDDYLELQLWQGIDIIVSLVFFRRMYEYPILKRFFLVNERSRYKKPTIFHKKENRAKGKNLLQKQELRQLFESITFLLLVKFLYCYFSLLKPLLNQIWTELSKECLLSKLYLMITMKFK
jgi:hypothetical protein